MDKTETHAEGLQFIFTEKDFYLDAPALQEERGEGTWRAHSGLAEFRTPGGMEALRRL